jgi:hypothetical protein
MMDKTQHEIARTLFIGTVKKSRGPDPRVDALVAMVFDLLMEVEALRRAQLASNTGARGTDSAYGRAYRDTAYLTHNASGPSSGLEKLLALFYPAETQNDTRASGQQRTWRDCVMLQRLGFSLEQVRAYQEEAERAETFT